MNCSKCGNPLKEGKKFCGNCGSKVSETEILDVDLTASAGFVHWNILPGQLAIRIDENDLSQYRNIKGVVVQDGLKALFFADGVLAGELSGGKYSFKNMGIEELSTTKKFVNQLASFFTGRRNSLIVNASSIAIILLREAEFPLIFTESNIPTAGIHSDVAIHLIAKITNILEFYRNQFLDKKIVSFQQFSQVIEPAVRNILEEQLRGIDAESLTTNTQMRQEIQNALNECISECYPYVSLVRIIRMSADTEELANIRQLREELYVSEKELVELVRRNDFLNRLNDVQNQQIIQEAQTQADFVAAMNKIDEQNQLTEDEKAKFAVDEALSRFPENSLLLTFAGDVARALGDDKKAVEYWEKAFAIDKEMIDAQYSLAKYFLEPGKKDEALNISFPWAYTNQFE